jgi:hypothetical protein
LSGLTIGGSGGIFNAAKNAPKKVQETVDILLLELYNYIVMWRLPGLSGFWAGLYGGAEREF